MRLITATLLVALSGAAFGQVDPSLPSFEVASVKASDPLPPGVRVMLMGGLPGPKDPSRLDYKGVSLRALLAEAYDIKDYQVEGPAWIESERYDVMAKIPEGDSSRERVRLMLRRLLAERFLLTLHRDSKSLPVYTLSVAKGGPKLPETDPKVVAEAEARRAVAGPPLPPPPPPPPPVPGGRMPSPPPGAMTMMFGPGNLHMKGSYTMAHLCEMLSNIQDRPVVDLTGLTGTYDLDLTWVPEGSGKMSAAMIPAGMAPPAGVASAEGKGLTENSADPGLSLVQALANYGLKLEPKKNPADILVIDRAEKVPTEN